MPQPQSLPVQPANQQHDPSIICESQPESRQSIDLSSPSSTTTQSNQQRQQNTGVDQQIQQQQEQQLDTQASQSTFSYASLEAQQNEGRSISCKDIQLVQNLIERCLQLYMNKGEVINTLLNQAKIQSSFTSLVWQKLEEQNPDFFKAYYTRLKLKKQILLFNNLMEQQADLMQKMCILPTSSHTFVNDMYLSSMDYPTRLQIGMSVGMSVSASPRSSTLPIQDDNHRPHDGSGSNCLWEVKSEVLPSVQPSNPGMLSDASPVSTSAIDNCPIFPNCSAGHAMEMPCLSTNPPSLPLENSFGTHEPHSQSSHVALSMGTADTDENSVREIVGPPEHLPRNFSLSDLTAELGPNSDLGPFGSYSSPFLPSEASAFDFDDERILDFMLEHLRPDFRVLKE